MSKKIELIIIGSAEQDIAMRSTLGAIDHEAMSVIQRSKSCGLYDKTKSTPFGTFCITKEGALAGSITLTPTRSKSLNHDQTVDIEISYSLSKEFRGAGVMSTAIELALQHIQSIKSGPEGIPFVECSDCTNPENHYVFTAVAIGTVYANISSISNYPSLASALNAGGEITEVSEGIKVTFLSQELPLFSDSFKSQLKKCSKTLCALGFNEYEVEDDKHGQQTPDQKRGAQEALEELIKQTDNPSTKTSLKQWLSFHVLQEHQKLPQEIFAHTTTPQASDVSGAAAGAPVELQPEQDVLSVSGQSPIPPPEDPQSSLVLHIGEAPLISVH